MIDTFWPSDSKKRSGLSKQTEIEEDFFWQFENQLMEGKLVFKKNFLRALIATTVALALAYTSGCKKKEDDAVDESIEVPTITP